MILALTCFVAHEQTPFVKLKFDDQHSLQNVALVQVRQPSPHFTRVKMYPFRMEYVYVVSADSSVSSKFRAALSLILVFFASGFRPRILFRYSGLQSENLL